MQKNIPSNIFKELSPRAEFLISSDLILRFMPKDSHLKWQLPRHSSDAGLRES